MTIGNDIKPRKVYYPRNHQPRSNSEASENFDDSKNSSVKEVDDPQKAPENVPVEGEKRSLEAMQDEFFENFNKSEKSAEAATSSPKIIRIGPGKIIIIMVIIILGILVVQNFSSIRGFLFPQKNAVKTPAPKTEEYTSQSSANSNVAASNTNSEASANANAASAVATETTPSTSTSTVVPTASSVALKVLNGNGVSGTAASVAEELREAGFTVQSVSNAKSFSYTATIIYYKTGKEAEANLVKNSIKSKPATIENSDSAVGNLDVVVVVGKN